MVGRWKGDHERFEITLTIESQATSLTDRADVWLGMALVLTGIALCVHSKTTDHGSEI
jgi:hypothetical protein